MRRTRHSPEDPRSRCETELPAEITSIRPQKKRSSRFSLYHNDSFIIGVSSDTLLHFNLERGVSITDQLFREIASVEQKTSIREYLLRLLGRRDHSRQELYLKALRKGHPPSMIEEVLKHLESKRYINDTLFAEKYAVDKATLMNWGPNKIRAELKKKGIPDSISDQALKRAVEDLQQEKICVDLALKRKDHFLREQDDRKRRQKIIAYLQRRGLGYDTIRQALPEILNQL
ncbi:MAG: regulatory protein RecX [Balneolaceae bacterium]